MAQQLRSLVKIVRAHAQFRADSKRLARWHQERHSRAR